MPTPYMPNRKSLRIATIANSEAFAYEGEHATLKCEFLNPNLYPVTALAILILRRFILNEEAGHSND